jgi:hypothetical protein
MSRGSVHSEYAKMVHSYVMVIRDDQLAVFAVQARREFLLTTVCDWFAIYEQAYLSPPSMSFDEAWVLADDVVGQLEEITWNPNEDHTYTLVHQILLAHEKGAGKDCIDRALTLFSDAMPSDEAGFALLTLELKLCQRDAGSY